MALFARAFGRSCCQVKRGETVTRNRRERVGIISRSSRESESIGEEPPSPEDESEVPAWVSALGGIAAWAIFTGYSFIWSPNQTPNRDVYLMQKTMNYFPTDGFHLNEVFFSIWFLFGIVSSVYAALMIPAGRSKNKVPVWPFLTLSFAFGNFALLPYTAIWQPDESITLPPTKEDLKGWSKIGMRITESAIFPLLLLVPTVWLIGKMVLCGSEEWIAFFQYFEESRLVHVSTLDLVSLVVLLPFWMNNDATGRKWKAKDQLVPILSFLPIVGPVLYLILRPKVQR